MGTWSPWDENALVKYWFWALRYLNNRNGHQVFLASFPFLLPLFGKCNRFSYLKRTEDILEHGDQSVCRLVRNCSNRREVHI